MDSARNVGQAMMWGVMGSEAIAAIHNLRWMIVAVAVLIVVDFRFGRSESRKRLKEAKEQGNRTLMKLHEFRMSRAIRRTCNKFIDYMTLLLVFCILGLAVTEPYGICSHVMASGVAVVIAAACELYSIAGHFFFLKGIPVPQFTGRSVLLFFGRLLAGFVRTKDEDLGTAIDEAIDKTKGEEVKLKVNDISASG